MLVHRGPRLSGRPLLDTRVDQELFVGRGQEVDRLARSCEHGLNALVVGEPGSGRTTTLRRLGFCLREGGRPAVFVDAGSAGTPVAVLRRVAAVLDVPASDDDGGHDLTARLAGALGTERPPVLLVDGLPPATAHPLFGQLRDELWAVPTSWVVSASVADEPTFLRPPADAFFETVLGLAPMPEADLRRLVRARVTPEQLGDDQVEQAARLAQGSPRRALDLARRLVVDPAATDRLAGEARDREAVLRALGQPARMLLAELGSLGAASASDERLLSRLGWTRGRAAQVFGDLEAAGLVASSPQHGSTGRPRKVYRAVESDLSDTMPT